MIGRGIAVLTSLVLVCLLPLTARAQVVSVWALGDGEKVFREDLDHPEKNGNHVWDGNRIRLNGLYNEVLAFQVIVETGQAGADGLEVVVDLPTHRRSGATIAGSTLAYGPAGAVEIFSQHYVHVKDSTAPNWFYGSPAAAPKQMTGWIPDALIPADATPGRGGFPVAVGPTQNQGFWIDLALPRDQERFPAGRYEGTVRVLDAGQSVAEIPLEVELLPHFLPDEDVNTVWLFTADVSDYFPGTPREELDKMLKFAGQRHRVDVTGGFRANQSAFDPAIMEAYKPYLDGSGYTPANGYYGPGQGAGEKLFPVGMYGGRVLGETKASIQTQAGLWAEWFEKNAPDVTYFWYLIDEPGRDRFPWIRERGAWIDSAPGKGKNLPVFTTTHFRPELEDAIDIWAAYNGVDVDVLPQIRKEGGDHWFYNGNRPRYGSVILEGAAVDFRVNSWILYKYDVNVHFIWHGTHWRHNSQGPKGRLHQNVFRHPLTFMNDGLNFGNGDGIIFYPGRMPFYPDEDRGLNQVLPSIRLKNIRRGQQDAAIMKMVEDRHGRDTVLKIIDAVVPKALSEVDMDAEVPWAQEGEAYDRARQALLELL